MPPTATATCFESLPGEAVREGPKRHALGAEAFPTRAPSLVSVPVGAVLRPPKGLGRESA
jgi:hypothetical protein